MNKMNFIRVQDSDTAEQLKAEGFEFVKKENNYYLFLNNNKLKFSDNIDIKKINYTNKMCI